MLLEAGEAHSCCMTVGDLQIRSHSVPVDLGYVSNVVQRCREIHYRFVVELLQDSVEEPRCGAIIWHDCASAKACYVE